MAKKQTNEFPSNFLDVVEVDCVTRERVSMTSGIYTPSTKLIGLVVREVPVIALIENTICECASRTNGEEIALQTRSIGVDVEYRWSLIERGSDHM